MADSPLSTVFGVILFLVAGVVLIFLRRLVFSLITLVLTNSTLRTILGGLLCLGGLVFGLSSHFVPYQTLNQGSTSLLLSHVNTQDDGNVYVQDLNHLGVYYVIHDAEFSPQIDARSFQYGARFTSLTYDNSTFETITLGSIDAGKGYTVVQFSLDGSTFTTNAYRFNPLGPFQNNWLIGGSVMCVGLCLLFITFGIPYLTKRWESASTV